MVLVCFHAKIISSKGLEAAEELVLYVPTKTGGRIGIDSMYVAKYS